MPIVELNEMLSQLKYKYLCFNTRDISTGWLKSFESKNERMCIF